MFVIFHELIFIVISSQQCWKPAYIIDFINEIEVMHGRKKAYKENVENKNFIKNKTHDCAGLEHEPTNEVLRVKSLNFNC